MIHMGRKRGYILLVLLCFNLYFVSNTTVEAKNYTIGAQDSIVFSYQESSESIVMLEFQIYTSTKYHVEVRNLSNIILSSRYNYTEDLHLAFIKEGQYTVNVTNPNSEEIEISFEKDSFPIVRNSDIDGFSYKNTLYCWSFNSVDESYQAVFPISTVKSKYYELFFIVENADVSSIIRFSYKNPATDADWADNLDSIGYSRNGKTSLKVENEMNWLVTELTTTDNYDVLVILYDSPVFTVVGKVIVGIVATGAAIALFLLVYYNPLKFRKRKVEGESYDKRKTKYETPENLQVKAKELFSEE